MKKASAKKAILTSRLHTRPREILQMFAHAYLAFEVGWLVCLCAEKKRKRNGGRQTVMS